MVEKRFVNELGNTIHITVTRKETDGTEGILISLSGPRSVSENHITKEEALVLRDLLTQTLGDAPAK